MTLIDKIITKSLNPDIDKDVLPRSDKIIKEHINNLKSIKKKKDLFIAIEQCLQSSFVQGYLTCGSEITRLAVDDTIEYFKKELYKV